MSEVAVQATAIGKHDWLSAQARAIEARLALVFPASLFQFKYLPPDFATNRTTWKNVTQGNQPFLGLAFVNVTAKTDGRVMTGIGNWMLVLMVRYQNAKYQSLLLGDAQGIGVLKMAFVAAAVLNAVPAGAGSVSVGKIANAMSEAFDENSAVMAIDLAVPVTFTLRDGIGQPPGLGIFEELRSTWNVPEGAGSVDVFTSDWENPNA